jgi:hypothetical protein
MVLRKIDDDSLDQIILAKMREATPTFTPSNITEEIVKNIVTKNSLVSAVWVSAFNNLDMAHIPDAGKIYSRVRVGYYFNIDAIVSLLLSSKYNRGRILTVEWPSIPDSISEWYTPMFHLPIVLEIAERELQEFFSPYILAKLSLGITGTTMKINFKIKQPNPAP